MLSAREFTNKLYDDSAAMFEASKMQVKAYFESDLSKDELVDHFIGRMTNERMNMVEISKKISELPKNTSVQEYQLLCKQALDEAIHYRLVKEVVEHLTGKEVDLEPAIDSWESRIKSKGASLIEKFDGHNDPIALALYQMIAEGRAEAVWDQMADTIQDEFISTRYRRVARDEGFHSNIGKIKLEELLDTEEKQQHAAKIASEMRKELYRISCMNTKALPEARKLMEETYNYQYAA